ncbi:cytochrome c oxidase subunit 7B, mitochondrial isoform X2 [Theropithecus gelada]|uniref:cytochrome c oxidase subunit 7B, mitochondrial isoform X2 n=1 Tax=Theropithecus gelada TaxID=9565 RepID=UPI000DC18641|nr:cytochrome c oxidase subunit 7B, mitochondrial isoform X2 [Theropithecus gelada]
MFPLVKNALNRLQVRSIQQTMARQSHQKRTPDFHDKYGSNTNWNRMEPVPCWQSYPKGVEKSVIIPAGVIMNCLKNSS